MSDNPLEIVGQAACANLLSKGMYVTGMIDPGEVDRSDGYCWCNQTQNMYGPDDQYVDRTTCVAGRQCYVARL